MTVTAMPKTSATAKPDADGSEEPAKKGKKKKLVVILLVLLLVGGGAYWFVLRPKPASAPKPGSVLALDAIQINLEAEHYLRLGIALQLVDGVKEEDGSKALDAAIDEFSGRPLSQVNDPARRRQLKKELEKELEKRYPDEVMGVYFTEFVTQ